MVTVVMGVIRLEGGGARTDVVKGGTRGVGQKVCKQKGIRTLADPHIIL